MDVKTIIDEAVKNGATLIKDIKVLNVSVTELDDYTRLGLTLDKAIPAFVADEYGQYSEGTSNVIFTSDIAISGILKNDDKIFYPSSHFSKNPNGFMPILRGAHINVLQQKVLANEEYKNPFSSSEKSYVYDHDWIANSVYAVTLSDYGVTKLDKLADMLLFGE